MSAALHALLPAICHECSGAIATGEVFRVLDGRRAHERCAKLAHQIDAQVAALVVPSDDWSSAAREVRGVS